MNRDDIGTWVLPLLAVSCATAACQQTDHAQGLQARTVVIADGPVVEIGVVDGEAPYTLSGVVDATLLSSGTIVVADCQSGELRYFDERGRHFHTTGGRGRGPGEFTRLVRIFPTRGDSIGAFDLLNPRVSFYDAHGTLARTVTLGQLSPLAFNIIGRLTNGMLVGHRIDTSTDAEPGSKYRARVTLMLLDGRSGLPVDSIVVAGVDMLAPTQPREPTPPLRLHRNAVFAVDSTSVFYGAQDETGIYEFDSQLATIHQLHTLTSAQPVTRDVRQRFEEAQQTGADVPKGGIGQWNAPEFVDNMPAFGDIVMGRDGRVWIQDPIRPGVFPRIWTAYRGSSIVRAEMARRFFPFEFGEDWVLGVAYDSLNVEHVQLWKLVPGRHSETAVTPRDYGPPMLVCGAWHSR